LDKALSEPAQDQNSLTVDYNGTSWALPDLCVELNAQYELVWKRLQRGWPLDKALKAKVQRRRNLGNGRQA
jgi:hypothetical protein